MLNRIWLPATIVLHYQNWWNHTLTLYHAIFSKIKQKYNISHLYSRGKKWNTPTNSNTNCRREMKLVPINMDYCLLQFDALKFFPGVRLRRQSVPNFNFFNINRQISQLNRKAPYSNCLDTNFHHFSSTARFNTQPA